LSHLQAVYDIAQICAHRGAHQAVLCPGSRCAPLTIAFSRHPEITTRTLSDERSAGFVGLGIARQTHSPVILVCTSGSAAYNFAPAIAEAFYSLTPLLVFTADRPAEWIDQLDGQAIRQKNIYGDHVKQSWTLPEDYGHPDSSWHINRIVNDAIALAMEYPQGPVHINTPFREPFYPAINEEIVFSKSIRIINSSSGSMELSESEIRQLKESLISFDKILIVAGQDDYDEPLVRATGKFSKQQRAALVGDIISNFHGLSSTVRLADTFLAQGNETLKKSLRPQLLITFGKSVISKSLKVFIRSSKPEHHWHIQPSGSVADTFQSLTRVIRSAPIHFFESLLSAPKKQTKFEAQKRENYVTLWETEERRTARATQSFFNSPVLSELHLVSEILKTLPPRCNLHLSNSMSVRYANFIGLTAEKKGIRVFANRGTSGIDGCTSTAVGHSLSSDVPNFLITGDVAFFYDRNAFWHNYPTPNLRIIVLNNHGGIIFSLIDGPAALAEREEYFVTRQKLNAQSLASEFEFGYARVDAIKKLKNALKDFYEFGGKTKILELETSQAINIKVFEDFKKEIRKGYAKAE
jgi:2-succinyl-5-enolpyruvyl-6-hydroxy-3-cyclohexene-1-carboxylate synthase